MISLYISHPGFSSEFNVNITNCLMFSLWLFIGGMLQDWNLTDPYEIYRFVDTMIYQELAPYLN